jgi:hypothetical protein
VPFAPPNFVEFVGWYWVSNPTLSASFKALAPLQMTSNYDAFGLANHLGVGRSSRL